MAQTSDSDKLRFLMSHWIEHNLEHANEFRAWAAKVRIARKDILTAAEYLEKASHALEAGLEKLGGPLEREPHSHEA